MTKEEMVELLKTDVPAWNRWRSENPNEKIDLQDANLRWAALAWADLAGANLKRANLKEAYLAFVDLEGAKIIPDGYDESNVECSNGVHFFLTKEEAERF